MSLTGTTPTCSSVDQAVPIEVKPWLGQVNLGAWSSCYTAPTGAVRCWGHNGTGGLGYNDTQPVGDGTQGRSIIEMGDVPIGGPVLETAASYMHRCALLVGGTVRCWGLNPKGQLGHAHTNNIGDGPKEQPCAKW